MQKHKKEKHECFDFGWLFKHEFNLLAYCFQFNYKIHLVADGKYGSPEGSTQEWTGMVRELMDRVSV